MKNLMLIIAVALLTLSVRAQRKIYENAPSTSLAEMWENGKDKQETKTKIKKEELPQATRNTLDSDAFKGWTFVNAYKLNNGEFEVELKKGETTQVLKFDKEGKAK